MASKRILIGPSSFGKPDAAPLALLASNGLTVVPNPFGRKLTKAELLELLPGMTGLIAGLEVLDREVLAQSDLKVISRCGAGMSNVDVEAAKERGVHVYSTPFGPTRAVAELTVGCLLALMRQAPVMDRAMRAGRWDKRVGRQLHGMRVLIAGYGRIGRLVGELLQPFGVELMVYDPLYAGAGAGLPRGVDLAAALPQADVITLHASGVGCLLGPAEFGRMKDGVFLLNAARGGLIDEPALRQALDTGKVAGAWLDTFAEEPYKGRLLAYEQVLLTPHVASYTEEGRQQMEMEAVNNLLEGLRAVEEHG